MFHIQTSPNVAVFPDSLQNPSLLDISGFPGRALPDLFIFSDSLHHSLPFPIVFIFRLGHFGTCPPSSRLASYPIVFRMFLSSIFGHFRIFRFHIRKFPEFPDASVFLTLSDVPVFFTIRFAFHNSQMFPHFMFGLSWITSSSSRFASYSITSEFVSLLPVLAGHKEFDPGPLSLETETQQYVVLGIARPTFWLPFRLSHVTCTRRTRRLLRTPSSDTTRKTKHMAPMFLFPNTVYSICAVGPCLLHISQYDYNDCKLCSMGHRLPPHGPASRNH